MSDVKSYTHPKGDIPAELSGKTYHAKRSLLSWTLYDWANSAFNTVIITFIFSVFFADGIVQDKTQASIYWGYAMAVSGIFIAVLGPFLGAVADHSAHRKRWLAFFSLICILCSCLLFFATPDPSMGNILYVLILVGIANIGFELSQVFYNAMLPHIAPSHMQGRVSGWGWAVGYLGGLAALALTLFGLVGFGDTEPFLPISGADSANIRASGPLVGLWFLVFMMPLLVFTKDVETAPLSLNKSFQAGLAQIKDTFKQIKEHGNLARFLIASAIYRDGLVTLFALGGIYAAGQYGMNLADMLFFAIYLNISAAIGSFLFAHVDDWIGSRLTIIIGLFGLILTGLLIITTHDQQTFMMLSIVLGIFIGPVQAASRTLAGRLSPPGMTTQTFGFFAFTGKSIAFLGPFFYGLATDWLGTQQAGIMSIILFWLVGLIVLLKVRE